MEEFASCALYKAYIKLSPYLKLCASFYSHRTLLFPGICIEWRFPKYFLKVLVCFFFFLVGERLATWFVGFFLASDKSVFIPDCTF